MTRHGHLVLLVAATSAWIVFWIAGLPAYYQQYSAPFMLWFDLVALAPLTGVFAYVLRRVPPARRMNRAWWMAFYFTLPVALYDWLYCGLYLGHGAGFLWRYWYLTAYYVIPWLLLPGVAARLNHTDLRRGQESTTRAPVKPPHGQA